MPILSRRAFLQSAAVLPALPAVHRARRGERVRVGCVGVWNRGRANLEGVLGEEIVALCDVDTRHLASAARLVEERTGAPLKAQLHRDFRAVLEGEDLDAVVVSTPDHTHGPVAVAAMRAGLHVYCEKPLAHSVHAIRLMQELAREKGLATQMGTQIHAEQNYRRVVELVRAGVIGEVRRAEVWCNKSWSNGRFGPAVAVPEHLDWGLWQGPVPERAYCEGLHPANWRRFWDYGTGTLGDMACHYVDLVHWALELGVPDQVWAEGPAEVHPAGTPSWLSVRWVHRRGTEREVEVTWRDGERAREVAEPGFEGGGQRFVGSEGVIVSDYGRVVVQRDGGHEAPEPWIPPSVGHHREWLDSIRDGTPTTCDFAYSGALAEAVLLGNVAYRVGRPWTEGEARAAQAREPDPLPTARGGFYWDAERARASRTPDGREPFPAAQALVRPPTREGWGL